VEPGRRSVAKGASRVELEVESKRGDRWTAGVQSSAQLVSSACRDIAEKGRTLLSQLDYGHADEYSKEANN
jgi:hypothetical protein